ncbi:MAG: hypothetical protein ACKPKO_44710, partial [Candidatus Fonsibacter sp.]
EAASAAEFTEPPPFKRPPMTPAKEGPKGWPKPPLYPPWEEPLRTTSVGIPTPPSEPPPGVPRPPSTPPPRTGYVSVSADVTGASSTARSSTDTSPQTGEATVSFLKRGPPKVPTVLEQLSLDKLVGETEEEYKVRVTSMRYTTVTGNTDL